MTALPREANYVGQRQSQNFTPAQTRRIGHKTGIHGTLSSAQFMPMNAVKRLPALDNWGQGSVGEDLIPMKHDEIAAGDGDTADYNALHDAMAKGGPGGKEVPPVHIASGHTMAQQYSRGDPDNASHLEYQIGDKPKMFGNGGHRIAMASDLGWKAVPYTSDVNKSGWNDKRFRNSTDDDDDTSSWSGSSEHVSSGEPSSGVNSWGPPPKPPARSHIPGHTGQTDDPQFKGNRWHAQGRAAGKPPGQGLYSQLHPALSGDQFGSEHKPGTGQPKLPGMPLHFKGGGPTDWSEYQRRNNPQGMQSSVNRALADADNRDRGAAKPTYGSAKRKVAAWADNIAAGGGGGKGGRAGQLNTADKETHWPGGGRIATGDRSTSSVRRRAAAGL